MIPTDWNPQNDWQRERAAELRQRRQCLALFLTALALVAALVTVACNL